MTSEKEAHIRVPTSPATATIVSPIYLNSSAMKETHPSTQLGGGLLRDVYSVVNISMKFKVSDLTTWDTEYCKLDTEREISRRANPDTRGLLYEY
jgi:hypothetical protein